MLNLRIAAGAAVLSLLTAIPALAADGTLQVIIGGEAYDGPPRFEVSFGGTVLGEAAVEAAIDTAKVGRFADAEDKTPYVESLNFTIPEAAFNPSGEVRLRLINEAYGGDGSNRDRNLYLAAVAVNGQAVTLSGFTTRGTSAETENQTLGEFLVLLDGNVEAVTKAPKGGWPSPGAFTVASTTEAAAPVAVETPAPVAVSVPKPAEAETATAEAASAPAPVPATTTAPEPVAVASNTAPETSMSADMATPACGLDQLYNVIGFNENSNDLTAKLEARLDQIVADIGTEKCKVQVTGYSSMQGDHATNALFAIERAQNVLAYLRQAGLSFEKATAAGGGATDQFGDDFASNRRVVITVAP